MEIRSIKGVDEETWRGFKTLAAKNNLKMSLLLKMMINEFERKGGDFWSQIFSEEKNLADKEAKDIAEITSKIRKERGFRV